MKIRTDKPFAYDRMRMTETISQFWDQLSEGWRTVWGPHIHHGYYENNPLTPLAAQEKLIEKLADLLNILPRQKILDVGCGMGGSSCYLAKKYFASVIGITLSSTQVKIATNEAHAQGLNTVWFAVEDALSLTSFTKHSFDIVWSLESCEQFYDKRLFLQQAYRVLQPGGKLMLATWCSSSEEYEGKLAKEYRKLCLAFDLPYMPTLAHYRSLLQAQGFHIQHEFDWSSQVKQSWDVGLSLIQAYSFLQQFKLAGWRGLRFAMQINKMKKAFQQQQIQYGVFIATKPH